MNDRPDADPGRDDDRGDPPGPGRDDDALDAASVRAIVEHMNADHADALAACVQAFAGGEPGEEVRMTGIDRRGIDVVCGRATDARRVRVDFPDPLGSVADARRALVALTRRARARLGVTPPDAAR